MSFIGSVTDVVELQEKRIPDPNGEMAIEALRDLLKSHIVNRLQISLALCNEYDVHKVQMFINFLSQLPTSRPIETTDFTTESIPEMAIKDDQDWLRGKMLD